MPEATVTPGPWSLRLQPRGRGINGAYIVGLDCETITARIPRRADKPISQKEGDAELIVSAVNVCFSLNPNNPASVPKLVLEMLRLIRWRLDSKGDTQDFEEWKEAARALIKKLDNSGGGDV